MFGQCAKRWCLIVTLVLLSPVVRAEDRPSASKQGSLLYFPAVEVKWDGAGNLIQDTLISLSNHADDDVFVQISYVNGDAPLDAVYDTGDPGTTAGDVPIPDPVLIERAHDGWNKIHSQMLLTTQEPTYFSAMTGLPACANPFNDLDPGGRPDLESATGDRVLRGYAVVWAIDREGREINWNALTGEAVTVNYRTGSASEYRAYAFRALQGEHGAPTDDNFGQLLLNGVEYDAAYDSLMMNFFASGDQNPSQTPLPQVWDTDLTVVPVGVDLRKENFGPITTELRIKLWNQNETPFEGPQKLVSCWDQMLFSRYADPNYFLRTNLQTDMGQARIDGVANMNCETLAIPAALLGVATRLVSFTGDCDAQSASASTLIGEGCEEASVIFDTDTASVANDVPGDCDYNEILNLRDWGKVLRCLTGPDGGPVRSNCRCADSDADQDVDAADLAWFQRVFGRTGGD